VPLYAYPLANIESFPDTLHFPPTPVGQRRTKTIPLQCSNDVSFEFQVSILERNPAFSIEPLSGIIDSKSKVELVIAFTPQEYCTTQMVFQVLISEFNNRPLMCTVTGLSLPGLTKELIEKQVRKISDQDTNDIIDPRALSPLNRSRNRKSERKKTDNNNSTIQPKEVVQDGIRFPRNLKNPAAVTYVLSQKSGKLRAKDLREAVEEKDPNQVSSKQMKEAVFEHLVNRQVAEEERNQLRWCVKLGDDSLSNMEREKILKDRERTIVDYHIQRGDPQIHEEFDRSTTLTSLSRTQRDAGEYATDSPSFDIQASDNWHKRHTTLNRFMQTARKVLIRERVRRHIKCLSNFMSNWRRGKFSTDHIRNWEELDNEEQIMAEISTSINPNKVNFFSFPDYENSTLKDDMAVDALGVVPISPINMETRKYVQFHRLTVPCQHKVLGYSSHAIPSSIYVPNGLARPLRASPEETKADFAAQAENEGISRSEMSRYSIVSDALELLQDDLFVDSYTTGEFQLIAPSVLFKKRKYPPLHIFNPAPGLLLHAPQLQRSEADEENKLLPVPNATDNNSPLKLHREDVIQGSMTWKRFPLQGLVSLNHIPTISNVFVPRWSDPFNVDMMPNCTPDLLTKLPDDDAPTDEEDEVIDSANIIPTMEMISAQFVTLQDSQTDFEDSSESFAYTGKLPLNNNPIGKHGPLSRGSREKELEKLVRDRKNKLGQRILINSESFKHYWQPDLKDKTAPT